MASFTQAKFKTWIPAREALEIISGDFDSKIIGVRKLLDHLKAGLLKAKAEHSYEEEGANRSPISALADVPLTLWDVMASSPAAPSNDLWKTNNTLSLTRRNRHGYGADAFRYYLGVRFEPKQFRQLLRSSPLPVEQQKPEATTASESASKATDDPKSKAPPVSQAALDAWCAAYKLAYQGPEDTLAKAYESAEGMFPGKFVARQRIRDLLKGRKAGRKAT